MYLQSLPLGLPKLIASCNGICFNLLLSVVGAIPYALANALILGYLTPLKSISCIII